MTGRLMSERLGKWQFWTFFIGFNVTFMPHALDRAARHAAPHLHVLRRAEPRRLNLLSTAGVLIQAVGVLLLVVNVIWS
jgi:cytochrome c oxidase subunit I+III